VVAVAGRTTLAWPRDLTRTSRAFEDDMEARFIELEALNDALLVEQKRTPRNLLP
jgi:hypothetical protein